MTTVAFKKQLTRSLQQYVKEAAVAPGATATATTAPVPGFDLGGIMSQVGDAFRRGNPIGIASDLLTGVAPTAVSATGKAGARVARRAAAGTTGGSAPADSTPAATGGSSAEVDPNSPGASAPAARRPVEGTGAAGGRPAGGAPAPAAPTDGGETPATPFDPLAALRSEMQGFNRDYRLRNPLEARAVELLENSGGNQWRALWNLRGGLPEYAQSDMWNPQLRDIRAAQSMAGKIPGLTSAAGGDVSPEDRIAFREYGGGEFDERIGNNAQLMAHYRDKLGDPDATPAQVREAAFQDMLTDVREGEGDLSTRAAQVGEALRLAQGEGPYSQYGQQALEGLYERLRTESAEWTPDQRTQFETELAASAIPENLRTLMTEQDPPMDPVEYIRGVLSDKVDAEAAAFNRRVVQGTVDNPEATGWGDWLKTNWQTLLIPAGLALAAFGGNTGKVLGIMAMAAGGYNLYQRYDRLTNEQNPHNKYIQEGIQMAARQVDADGKETPFQRLEEVADAISAKYDNNEDIRAAVMSGLTDFTFLSARGFHEQIAERANTQATDFTNVLMGGQTARPVLPQSENIVDRAYNAMPNQLQGLLGGLGRILVPGGRSPRMNQ